MATTSLQTIMEELGEITGLIETHSTSQGRSVSLLRDNFLKSTLLPATFLDNCWVRLTNGNSIGESRRIKLFVPTNGDITPDRNWANTDTGDPPITYQLLRYLTWDDWKAAINRGLEGCYYVDEDSITILANTRQYNMPTWIERAADFIGATIRHGTTTDNYDRLSLEDLEIIEDAGVLRVNIPQLSTSDVLIVKGYRAYAALATDAATTTCPKKLALAAGKKEAIKKIAIGCPGEDRTYWERQLAKAEMEFTLASRKYTRRVPKDLYVGQPSNYGDPARLTWKDMK